MADTREESEPLLSRARGGSGRDCPRGVPTCSSVLEGPGEPRPGEGPGRAGAALRGPGGRCSVPAVAAGAPPSPGRGPIGPCGGLGGCALRTRIPAWAWSWERGVAGEGMSRPAPPTGWTERPRSVRGQPAQSPRPTPKSSLWARGLLLSMDRLGDP